MTQKTDLTADTDSHSNGSYDERQGRVRQVTMQPDGRALSTLSHVDYEDAFLVDSRPVKNRTPEQWARAVLEDAPMIVRRKLVRGWFALGLRLGSNRSDRSVLGWEVLRSTPDFALLRANGRLGLSGELLFKRQQQMLLFATFVQLDNRIARAVWALIAPGHRQVVRFVLERASRPAT